VQPTKFDLTINLKSAEALGLSACDAVDGSSGGSMIAPSRSEQKGNIAFVPLAMPIVCGPGAIATTLGMISLVKHSEFEFISFLAIAGAILATMLVTYLCLVLCGQNSWSDRPRGHRSSHAHRRILRRRHGRGPYFPWGNRSISKLRRADAALTSAFGTASADLALSKFNSLATLQKDCRLYSAGPRRIACHLSKIPSSIASD
jgi:hypothetical protein